MIFAKGATVKYKPGLAANSDVLYTVTHVIAGRDDAGHVTVSVKLKDWPNTWHSINLLDIVPSTPTDMKDWLTAHGWFVGERDPRLNTKYPGKFMVTECDFTDYELPTEDGSNGPWCIVGDNLRVLVKQAFDVHYADDLLGKKFDARVK